MKKLLKEIFSLENFNKAMVNLAFTNPRLTGADYLALSNALRETNSKQETQMQMKKAS